jgi:hypothetical protein
MKKPLMRVFFQSLLSVMLLPGVIGTPQENEKGIAIGLVRPSEGETFYAGPSSLLYNIPIHGWVESDFYRFEEIKVVLEIFQNSELVSIQEAYADASGVFEFYATVNPEGSSENFPATQADCSSYCHYLSEIVLPAGEMTLKLTAVDPVGNQNSLERHIIVDRSDYAYIPLRVTLDNSQVSNRALENIPVTASTWLYLWRSRHFIASTDGDGTAEIRIEALAQSPTQYWIKVEPTIVDGVLYYSEKPVEVFLAPGATSSSPVNLDVKTRSGKINGKLLGIDKSLVSSARILAIRQSDGLYYSEEISPQGDFVFDDIPLHEYMIVPELDGGHVSPQGFIPEAETINLIESPSASIEFTKTPMTGYILQGEIKADDNQTLPFAWVTNEELAMAQRVKISNSGFEIYGLPSQYLTFIVNAPGYYSRAYTLNPSSDESQALSPMLVRQPDTRIIPWGSGEIIVPPESAVEVRENNIRFQQGWLWGYTIQESEITIQHDFADIILTGGSFAFESLPNSKNWFYLFEGNATIYPLNGTSPVKVKAGEMVTLIQHTAPVPVVIDQTVVDALHSGLDETSQPVWEPTLGARIRDSIARVGIGGVQLVTFITYGLILISIVGFPLVTLYLRVRRRNQMINEENNERKQ